MQPCFAATLGVILCNQIPFLEFLNYSSKYYVFGRMGGWPCSPRRWIIKPFFSFLFLAHTPSSTPINNNAESSYRTPSQIHALVRSN